MTTAWPAAPAGTPWSSLDHLLETTAPLVDAESRRGGVHQVRWDPARRTRVAFEGLAGDVVVLEVTDDGVARHRLLDDEALGGVTMVLDPAFAAARLGPLLGATVLEVRAAPVSYRPGSRCVVRYDVATSAGRSTVFVKVLAEDFDDYVDGHGTLLAVAADRDMAPFVPPLVDRWNDVRAVVTLAAPGRSASSVLADDTVPIAVRSDLARRLGGLLAVVHGAQPGRAAAHRVYTAAAELVELERYLDVAWKADPATAVSMAWLGRDLRATMPEPRSTTFSHGSFRAGQVVVGDDGHLTLLDLDGVGVADPARDLANAMAHLDWQHLRTGAGPFGAAVEDGYRAGGGSADRHAVDWWRAAALAKIAGRRYRSLDTTTWSEVPALVRLGSDVLTPASAGSARSAEAGRPADVLDPSHMSTVLQPLLGDAGEATPHVTTAEVLQVAGGRRIVVRYRTTATDPTRRDVVAKAYAEAGRAVIAHENLVAFHALADPAMRVATPTPLGVLPARALVLFAAAAGRPVDALPTAAAADAARRFGTWLRGVHESPVQLRRRLDLGRESANVGLWATAIGRVEPRLATPARRLAEQIAAAADRVPSVRVGPIHKDLHLGHALVDDDGAIVVIDLDEARMGDPAFDVAHVVTYAHESPVPVCRPVVDAFLDGYAPLGGADVEGRYALYCAYTLLKITKQRVLRATAAGTTGSAVVEEGVRRLERGSAWLAV